MAGIYFHIPFCKQACHYCDFHFSTDARGHGEMVHSMLHELELRKSFVRSPVETLYFGGGTPSVLKADQLGQLIQAVKKIVGVTAGAEITLEANPDDLTREKLRELRQLGINRLSIGIQSFRDDLLKLLHRAHDSSTARRCLALSAEEGFSNLSLDLIYGIPGLDLETWKDMMKEALSFRPAHLSMYALTIEDRTVFGNWTRRKKFFPAEEELVAQQFELMQDVVEDAGYTHYEISNFCLPGMHSRHNSNYWLHQPYLGIGPSAHSYDGDHRYANIRNNAGYVKALAEDRLPTETEELTRENKINEYLLTRLRTQWGCDLVWLKQSLSEDLMARRGNQIGRYIDEGLLVLAGDILKLSRKGNLLADRITEELMI